MAQLTGMVLFRFAFSPCLGAMMAMHIILAFFFVAAESDASGDPLSGICTDGWEACDDLGVVLLQGRLELLGLDPNRSMGRGSTARASNPTQNSCTLPHTQCMQAVPLRVEGLIPRGFPGAVQDLILDCWSSLVSCCVGAHDTFCSYVTNSSSESLSSTTDNTSQFFGTFDTLRTTTRSPFDNVRCDGDQIRVTKSMTRNQYDEVVLAVQRAYHSQPIQCDSSLCPQADWAGCALRVAAHDFMDYKNGRGGSDGCIDYDDVENSGIEDCVRMVHVPLYEAFCTRISLADFIVITAEAVMNVTRQAVVAADPQRTTVDFRSRFRYGRGAKESGCKPRAVDMPDAERSCRAVEETLLRNMGLDWKLATALMGGHTLGSAHASISGYHGYWSDPNGQRQFDNDYYVSLISKGWAPSQSPGMRKYQWQRVDLGYNVQEGTEMMLNTDMCLTYGPVDTSSEVELNAALAASVNCYCAWSSGPGVKEAAERYQEGTVCGLQDYFPSHLQNEVQALELGDNVLNFTRMRIFCCGLLGKEGGLPAPFDFGKGFENVLFSGALDCGLPAQANSTAPAAGYVETFGVDEDAWFESFYRAWKIATSNGFGGLWNLSAIY